MSDEGSQFAQRVKMHLADRTKQVVAHEQWDVDGFALDEARTRVAYSSNENGAGILHIADLNGRPLLRPILPYAVLGRPR